MLHSYTSKFYLLLQDRRITNGNHGTIANVVMLQLDLTAAVVVAIRFLLYKSVANWFGRWLWVNIQVESDLKCQDEVRCSLWQVMQTYNLLQAHSHNQLGDPHAGEISKSS